MRKKAKYSITALCAALLAFGASGTSQAAPVTVKASLDSVHVLMGNVTTLRLEVVQDEGAKGAFDIFGTRGDRNATYAGVCGDSVELRLPYPTDTARIGSGRIQVNYEVGVQAFDSGSYRLPAFLYRTPTDSAFSNRVSLKVIPVQATADDPIAGYAGVAEPEGKSVLDKVPDWLYDYWWIFIILALAVGLGLWAWRRRGNVPVFNPRPKPQPSPYQLAMSRLRALKERKLWEKGMEKEYFTELTDTLRVYLQQRFGINAMEMTSRQIMDTLRLNPLVKDKRDYMRRILDMADFVKFAKVRPLPADNIAAYDNAVKFVEETHELGASPSEVGDLAKPLEPKGGES